MHTPRTKLLLAAALILACTAAAGAQTAKTATASSAAKPAPTAHKPGSTPEAPSASVAKYDSRSRRDPFLNPILVRKKESPPDEEIGSGQSAPGIAGMSVTQVALLGVSTRQGGRTAVFQGTDKRAYFLQEGDRFYDGYLKSIADDSVVLVRQRHYRSGKVVTDEITKRLRTP